MRCADPLDLNNTGVAHFPEEQPKTTATFNIYKAVELEVWLPSCQGPVAKLSRSSHQPIRARSSCRGLVFKLSMSSCWFTSSMSSCQKVCFSSFLSTSSCQGCFVELSELFRQNRQSRFVKPSRLSESSRHGCPSQAVVVVLSQAVVVVRVKPSWLS